MKIAIATEKGKISKHFGRSEKFTIVDFTGKKPVIEAMINCQDHKPFKISDFIIDKKVDIVICDGIGIKAIKYLKDNDIEVITGCKGSVKDVISKLENGIIKSKKSLCKNNECKRFKDN